LITCDDHAFTRAGLEHWAQADPRFLFAGQAANAMETLALARKAQPDIAVVDYNLPDANGLEVAIELARWLPACKVVILTAREDGTIVAPLLHSGVRGILCKTGTPEALGIALAAVQAGEVVVDPRFERAVQALNETVALSPREVEVLLRLARGMSNPAIAEDMALAVKTVETHRASLMRKLEVKSATALIVRAARLGLIDL
jgi:DNA-binding NarL/FixJ family response regulator